MSLESECGDGLQPEDIKRIFESGEQLEPEQIPDGIHTVTFFSLGYMNTNEKKDGFYKLKKGDDYVWHNPDTLEWYRESR